MEDGLKKMEVEFSQPRPNPSIFVCSALINTTRAKILISFEYDKF